jgi:hypothetical protein
VNQVTGNSLHMQWPLTSLVLSRFVGTMK